MLAGAGGEALAQRLAGQGDMHVHDHGDHHGHDHAHRHHHHKSSIRSFALTHGAPVDLAAIGMFLDLLRSQRGGNILRMKGIVWVRQDEDRPVVVHGVGALLHPPVRLETWPAVVYLDADGNQSGYEDVFSKIAMCRAHYAENGLGAEYLDQFIR